MERLETEVKYFLTDLDSARERILGLGARSLGRCFERNLRFEDAAQNLARRKSLLRLRQDTKATLTFKSQPSPTAHRFKTLKELEVEVADFGAMKAILEALGYHPAQAYEKWRETLVLNRTYFCLDTMPFGVFLEIEGPETDILAFTYRLGLDWSKRILLNYLELFEILRRKMNLSFSDVTFDNFKDIRVNLAPYLNVMEANRP